METAERAMARWIDALNTRGANHTTEAAISERVHVARRGNGSRRHEIVEELYGPEAVAEWIGRSPRGTWFQISGPLTPPGEDGAWVARYEVVIGDFSGSGTWRFTPTADGRLARLEHMPDDLPAR